VTAAPLMSSLPWSLRHHHFTMPEPSLVPVTPDPVPGGAPSPRRIDDGTGAHHGSASSCGRRVSATEPAPPVSPPHPFPVIPSAVEGSPSMRSIDMVRPVGGRAYKRRLQPRQERPALRRRGILRLRPQDDVWWKYGACVIDAARLLTGPGHRVRGYRGEPSPRDRGRASRRVCAVGAAPLPTLTLSAAKNPRAKHVQSGAQRLRRPRWPPPLYTHNLAIWAA
jgi:hypothetical protein